MKINSIELKFFHKGGFNASQCDNVCHVKTLPYLSVVQAVEGNYDIRLGENDTLNTKNGGIFIAPSDVRQTITHHVNRETGVMLCRWVFIKVTVNGIYDFEDLFSFPTIVPEQHRKDFSDTLDRLFASKSIFDDYICYHQLVKLLFMLARENEGVYSFNVHNALKFIKRNYQSTITVQDIADAASISPSRLYSIFKRELSLSPIAYLNSFRLSIAAQLLLTTQKTVTEIAAEVGINDPIYFNKLFKKSYQVPPTEYRKIYKS